jgi:hypothetical protein
MHLLSHYEDGLFPFQAFLIELDVPAKVRRIRRTDIRIILEPFYRRWPQGEYLFIFALPNYSNVALISPKRIQIRPSLMATPTREAKFKLQLRILNIDPQYLYHTDLWILEQIRLGPEDQHPLRIWEKHLEAFDVERVTKRFYEGYKQVFNRTQAHLRQQTRDPVWAHDYALQFLNRLMFLYFIQRKGWLGDNPRFIKKFWEAYRDSGNTADTFFKNWLSVLFFEAFNNRYQNRAEYIQRFPSEIRQAFAKAPFLNGGLFTRNELDTEYSFNVKDIIFGVLFDYFEGEEPGFLEKYNFTVVESTPLDVEVAVDPEMIGKVYESLVNITAEGLEEEDLRGTAGIFYTPRVEIDLMCRLALVDYLSNHLGEERKPLLYQAVFTFNEEEKQEADKALADANLWPQLDSLLREVTVLDPACGSGSFLVGMLLVLDDLIARANAQLGRMETPYQRRKAIIANSLYGVDVMPWAVRVAELRLWLQLVIETELQWWEMKAEPMLPNLSFKVRPGDSLVQEVGGISFALHRAHLDIPSFLKGRLTRLKGEKLKFFHNAPDRRYHTPEQIQQEELRLFRDILDARYQAFDNQLKGIRQQLQTRSMDFFGKDIPALEPSKARALIAEAAQLEQEQRRVKKAREALHIARGVPFVWDIAFVEIFEGEKKGFDIVIGNPPYVRQESIAPPGLPEEDFEPDEWREFKKEYKAKLRRSVYATYPRFFGYKWHKDFNPLRPEKAATRKVDGKSDLYVYFYLHGLSLLNDKGSFCFITSNSWLDVGYGRDLQEFLLRHTHIKMVLDNQARRSFSQADINTVIVLLSAPDERKNWGLEKTARFVMFRVPFEEVLSPVIFLEIEEATGRLVRPEFRAIVVPQKELYWSALEEKGGQKKYRGGKWGGKFLRAPDIFFTILEKGKGKLVRLGDIAEVRRGFTTGANDFFYLEPTGQPAPEGLVHVRNGAGWAGLIEAEYLRPMLFSLKECPGIRIDPRNFRYLVFLCRRTKSELRRLGHIHALGYIGWGESQTTRSGDWLPNAPSLRGRQLWYALPEQRPVDFISNRFVGERFLFVEGSDDPVCDVFFVGYFDRRRVGPDPRIGLALLNSTLTVLVADVLGRKTYGIGVVYLYGPEVSGLLLPDPAYLTRDHREALLQAFDQMCQRHILGIFEELGFPKPNRDYSNIHPDDVSLDKVLPDRRALDEVVFEALGLTEEEQLAVYRAVVELVKARLVKARSL